MPIIRVKEIRAMSHDDRLKRLSEMQTELMRLKTMVKAGGAIENPARVHEIRKTIARILTIDHEPKPAKTEETKEKKKKKEQKKQKNENKEKTTRKKQPKTPKEGKEK